MPTLIFGVMLRVFAVACSVFDAQTQEPLQSTAKHGDDRTFNLTYPSLIDDPVEQLLYRRAQSRRRRPTYLYMVAGAESEEPRRKGPRAGVASTSAAATSVQLEEDDDDLLGDPRPAPPPPAPQASVPAVPPAQFVGTQRRLDPKLLDKPECYDGDESGWRIWN